MEKKRWSLHLALVVLFGMAVGVLFIHEPGFGDDFTYWSFGFDLHERGLKAWYGGSFHDLRWPVWGVCWLLQSIFGPGLLSYYGEPVLYLGFGAALTFTFARMLTDSLRVSWWAAAVFLFHPLIDTVCYRPMPDLSEGIWGAATVLCWWRLAHAPSRGRAALWMTLLGVCIYITESNRLTGVFIVPVIALITLLYGRRRSADNAPVGLLLPWVLGAGVVAAFCYAGEAAFYHRLFGDWLHNLHANLGGKGKKGTEAIPLLTMPFRFLGVFWKESVLAPVLSILALVGISAAWRWRQPLEQRERTAVPLGRIIIIWAVLLYLEYACAPQSLWPWRPVIRDADRFLAGLTIPVSLLVVMGVLWLFEVSRLQQRRWGRWIFQSPWSAVAAVAGVVAITGAITAQSHHLFSQRQFFSLGWVPEMRKYVRSIPPGTKVFTHRDMRDFVFLADEATARNLTFLYQNDIIDGSPELEKMASQASEFWYVRKLIWLNTRKALEKKTVGRQESLPSYFDHPEKDWALAKLLAKGDTPDFVFYRRRTPEMPAPLILGPDAPEWGGLIPKLPLEWKPQAGTRSVRVTWPVPEKLRGKLVRVEIEAGAAEVQACQVTVRFSNGAKMLTDELLKPYLFPEPGKDFFVLHIPAEADECHLILKLVRGTVQVTGFRAVFEDGLEKP